MSSITATATQEGEGALTRTVRDFVAAQGAAMAAGVTKPSDWDPMRAYVSDDFRRVGAYLEELNWDAYARFLTGWASDTRFEFTEFHISEVGNAVFQEIEERHFHGETFIRKNVIAVYRFNAAGRICHLDIYEQATDSGAWIKDAARETTLA